MILCSRELIKRNKENTMKKKLEYIGYVILVFLTLFGAYKFIEWRDYQNELHEQRIFCGHVDARLISSGMVDCSGLGR